MKPNIIYLLSDQHNHRVMGNSGDSYARTPNLDSLYARGTALDSCYCAAPLCVPSRSSMLTGLLPTRNGEMGEGYEETSIRQEMKDIHGKRWTN